MTANPTLSVRGLSHRYGDPASGGHNAIAHLNFAIAPGEFVSIVGPSGSGKTTLLRIITGLLRPTEGSIEVAGKQVAGVPDDVAVVFQDYSRSLYAWMSVRRNIAFPLRRSRCSREERESRTAESLEAVGLTAHASRYPWQLSGGMQQRVAIARALAYRPRVLLMDEPFASVDAQTRADLEDLALSVHEQFEMTILFVTHDIDESVYLSDRVLVLSSPPAQLLADIAVPLPRPRDQLSTRQLPEFVRIRSEIASLLLRREVVQEEVLV